MNNSDKENLLKFIMGRFDPYYESINNKGNVYLTLNTFILGGVLAGYFWVRQQIKLECTHDYLLIIFLVFNLFSISTTLLALKPYLKSYAKTSKSILFFNDIASIQLTDFIIKIENIDENKINEDLVSQVYLLAKGLRRKFLLLNISTWIIGLEIITIIIFGFLILNTI